MKLLPYLAISVGAMLAAAPSSAAERLTTSIKPKDCVLYDLFETGASTACQGLGGYSLAIIDADARIYLNILHPDWEAPAQIDLRKITKGSFSSLPSDAVAWLGPKDAPTALILLLGYAQGDGKPGKEALAVIRLDRASHEQTCLVSSIPKGPKMAEEARRMADAASHNPCL